ncbi:MAG TPA: cobalamin-binding protein [Candidatus Syntrophoarchaeum butanivorans]|uniref:Cobalamin-binding protein n=1 Tax=Candidatus Syntropharchaeum butanivorans TaxID=1839936 RepID=A0A1F2P579_9EURY|nr:MAG: corrinoid protein [Candidatus Syntrophoarchaeum butanivorans]RJS71906.1 MAG: cobalamin-binding protein [Candidatus Syntrophoarchaeum sp. WYZ-LMO15]HDM36819.1 cobalamin-binding protein [Candidatus Syntrophoarchaeum butanivorans]HEC57850.1 cobalamin-binding protein [Candidatus Syntrophoarchaeum butanivorans]
MGEMTKEEFLEAVKNYLVVGDKENCVNLIKEYIDTGIATPLEILRLGLGEGMTIAGDKYEAGEYFVPEMLMCVDVMDAAMEIVMPRIKEEIAKKGTGETVGKVVIGVVEGDIHDIGKTITASLLEAAGFEVYDLGRDVPAEEFIKKAREVGAQVIAASTLMTPTLEVMEELHEELEEEGMRDQVKTIIGGGATSEEFAEEIGADAYAADAVEGVDAIKRMVEEIKVAMKELEKRAAEE